MNFLKNRDGTRLVFFSGGVESTALLELVGDDCILVCLETNFDTRQPLMINKKAMEHIAGYYGKKINYISLNNFANGKIWYHERHRFFHLFDFLVRKYPHITNICYSFNKEEFIARKEATRIDNLADNFSHFAAVWEVWDKIHPDIPLWSPTTAYYKYELWQFIPEELVPFVRSCTKQVTRDTECGFCYKCIERQESRDKYEKLIRN